MPHIIRIVLETPFPAMAPKNAKDTKNLDVISALKAFETTLRAASRHKGVAVPRPLLEQLQQCQEKSQPLSRIILTGIHSEQVAAVVDCLASYSAVKSLICLNCCVGDKGLTTIASLLRASGAYSRWWHGSRLQDLEICSDSRPACCGAACPLSPPAQQASSSDLPHRPATQASAAGHPRTLGIYEAIRPGTAPPPGMCPAMPCYLQLPTHQQYAQDDIKLGSLRQVRYRLQAPRTMMEVRAWALAPTVGVCLQKHKALANAAHSTGRCGDTVAACCFSHESLQQLSLALSAACGLQRLVLDHTVLDDKGISVLATGLGCCSRLRVLRLCYCGIGPSGVASLAEALTPARNKQPDHWGNSNNSSSTAAHGSGSRMSVASGIVPTAGMCAADAVSAASAADSSVAPASGKVGAVERGSSSSSSSSKPCLVELHLSGNPLGAAGLHAVSQAVKVMAALKTLSLADISLDAASERGQLEVQVLAHALLSGTNELNTLDFDNIISDDCALYFVGLLKAKESITLLKLTPRLSPNIIQQLSALLDQHQHVAKAGRVAKKAKDHKQLV